MKILFISHILNNTGAPLVLMDAISVSINQGYHVDVVSMEDGVLRKRLEDKQVSVTIADDFLDNLAMWQRIFRKYDLVVANTLLCLEAIYALNTTEVKTIWWIHEHRAWFEAYKTVLPKKEDLKSNIHIFGVSPVTNELIRHYCGYETGLLPFGIEDRGKEIEIIRGDGYSGNLNAAKVKFIFPGTYSPVKGQDILCKAVEVLPDDIRSRCEFVLCGANVEGEEEYYSEIVNASRKFPEVSVKEVIPHDDTLRLMSRMDYVLVPSRMEPFSATAVEGMMMGAVPIVSDICGVAYWLENGRDSFVFSSGNVESLAETISKAVSIRDSSKLQYEQMVHDARRKYENMFSMEKFSATWCAMINQKTMSDKGDDNEKSECDSTCI